MGTSSSFSDMRAHLVLALAAMLSTASAATVATGITRATTASIGANSLRLRGGLADDELATQAVKIGKVAVTLTVSVPHIRSVNAPPTKVVIVGSLPELGAWDVRKVCMRFYTYVYLIFRCSHAGVR